MTMTIKAKPASAADIKVGARSTKEQVFRTIGSRITSMSFNPKMSLGSDQVTAYVYNTDNDDEFVGIIDDGHVRSFVKVSEATFDKLLADVAAECGHLVMNANAVSSLRYRLRAMI